MIVDNSVYDNKIYLQTDNNFFFQHTMTKTNVRNYPIENNRARMPTAAFCCGRRYHLSLLFIYSTSLDKSYSLVTNTHLILFGVGVLGRGALTTKNCIMIYDMITLTCIPTLEQYGYILFSVWLNIWFIPAQTVYLDNEMLANASSNSAVCKIILLLLKNQVGLIQG